MSDMFTSAAGTTESVEQDNLGGRKIFDQDIYPAIIDMAYIHDSQSTKSKALRVVFDLGNSQTITKDYWFIGSDGNNYKIKDGVKTDTFGLTQLKALARVAINGEIPSGSLEQKIIKLYNYDSKKEENTAVDMMMGLVKAKVNIAISRIKKNKRVRQSNGSYKDVGAEVEFNEVAKVFSEQQATASEILSGTPPKFAQEWLDKNKGNIKDIFKAELVETTPTTPTKQTTPLFGD